MGKDAIIDKIMCDAKLRADAMVGEAKAKADSILAQTAEQCKQYLAKSKSETDAAVRDIAVRSEAVAELDAKKLMLKAKSEIVDSTFSLALDKARNLDAKTYKKLVLGMLEQAEDGDTVIISEREKKIITKETVAEYAKKKGIKLKLSDSLGDFDGGIILSGKGIDKNLTFEVELGILREVVEIEIAKDLVG